MVQVAWSTSNLKVYTARDGSATVCESCCDGFVRGEGCPILCGSGNTPLHLTVTLSGWAARCIYSVSSWKHYKTEQSVVDLINGTHVLTQLGGNACRWSTGGVDISSKVFYEYANDDSGCSGEVLDTHDHTTYIVEVWRLQLFEDDNRVQVRVYLRAMAGNTSQGTTGIWWQKTDTDPCIAIEGDSETNLVDDPPLTPGDVTIVQGP